MRMERDGGAPVPCLPGTAGETPMDDVPDVPRWRAAQAGRVRDQRLRFMLGGVQGSD